MSDTLFLPKLLEIIHTQREQGTLCAVCGFTEVEHTFKVHPADKVCDRSYAAPPAAKPGEPQLTRDEIAKNLFEHGSKWNKWYTATAWQKDWFLRMADYVITLLTTTPASQEDRERAQPTHEEMHRLIELHESDFMDGTPLPVGGRYVVAMHSAKCRFCVALGPTLELARAEGHAAAIRAAMELFPCSKKNCVTMNPAYSVHCSNCRARMVIEQNLEGTK